MKGGKKHDKQVLQLSRSVQEDRTAGDADVKNQAASSSSGTGRLPDLRVQCADIPGKIKTPADAGAAFEGLTTNHLNHCITVQGKTKGENENVRSVA